MNRTEDCQDCAKADAQKLLPATAKKIGEIVAIVRKVGRGHDESEYTFFQCAKCGSLWREIVDSGAGGHGRFASRLSVF